MLTFRQIDSFIHVAEAGSFAKAAEALFVTPAALIQQINLMETEIGFRVFRRSHSGVTLTEAGSTFLTDMRGISSQMEEAVARGRRMAANLSGLIRIGCVSQHASRLFLELHQIILSEYPQLFLELSRCEPQQATERLLSGAVDCCILPLNGAIRKSGLPHRVLRALPTYVGMPATHPLSCAEMIGLEELAMSPLVLPQINMFESTDMLRAALAERGIVVETIEENDNLRAEAACLRHQACRICTGPQAGSALRYVPLDSPIRLEIAAVYHPRIEPLFKPVLDRFGRKSGAEMMNM